MSDKKPRHNIPTLPKMYDEMPFPDGYFSAEGASNLPYDYLAMRKYAASVQKEECDITAAEVWMFWLDDNGNYANGNYQHYLATGEVLPYEGPERTERDKQLKQEWERENEIAASEYYDEPTPAKYENAWRRFILICVLKANRALGKNGNMFFASGGSASRDINLKYKSLDRRKLLEICGFSEIECALPEDVTYEYCVAPESEKTRQTVIEILQWLGPIWGTVSLDDFDIVLGEYDNAFDMPDHMIYDVLREISEYGAVKQKTESVLDGVPLEDVIA